MSLCGCTYKVGYVWLTLHGQLRHIEMSTVMWSNVSVSVIVWAPLRSMCLFGHVSPGWVWHLDQVSLHVRQP